MKYHRFCHMLFLMLVMRCNLSTCLEVAVDFPGRLEGNPSAAQPSEQRANGLAHQVDDVGHFEHLIERNDTSRPLTPSAMIMVSYVDPNRLPPSNGVVEEFGQRKCLYGSVRVLEEHAATYETVRRHMAGSGREVRKHLAEIETRPYPVTDIYPYSLNDRTMKVFGQEEGLPEGAETNPVTFPAHAGYPGHTRVVVRFPVDEGNVLPNGERSSAATRAAHELAHSARYQIDPSGSLLAPIEDQTADELFKDLDEYAVISQVENPIARAHGEGQRDSYDLDGTYLTRFIDSTTASNPYAEQIIAAAQPQLRAMTEKMEGFGFPNVNLDRPTGSNETLRNLYWERHYQHESLANQLDELSSTHEHRALQAIADTPEVNSQEETIDRQQQYASRSREREQSGGLGR